MKYDPIKRTLGKVFNATPYLRIIFYRLLDVLLLRSWHIHKALRRWNAAHKSNKTNILDAGSGFGQYTYHIARLSQNYNITGVDVKEEQIADCNNFFGKIGLGDRVKFEEADLTKYSQKNKFGLILSVDVMEHIEDDRAVFSNFYESLVDGGMLLISTPSDLGGSDADEHDHDGTVHGFIDEHVRDGYNIGDIEEKLRTAGFSKVDARYSYGTAGHISWILSMKWPILMLGASKLLFIILPFYYIIFYPWCLILNWIDVATKHSAGTGLIVEATK